MANDFSIHKTPRARLEWLTLGLIIIVYAAMALLIWLTPDLPWWLIMPMGATLVALHSSLQHEALHGHPTRYGWMNELLVSISLSLWVPYRRYRKLHLQHHNDLHLTDPVLDPESYYLLPQHWSDLTGAQRLLYKLNNTLLGRMVLGPIIALVRFTWSEAMRVAAGERDVAWAWALHIPACAITFAWLWYCNVSLFTYIALFAWPGIALSLVRSFCEHQAAPDVGARTIIVEAGWYFSLLFLNNNLHIAHHMSPRLSWYKLPRHYLRNRQYLITRNQGYLMHGYREVFQRYLLKPKEPVAHPGMGYLNTSIKTSDSLSRD